MTLPKGGVAVPADAAAGAVETSRTYRLDPAAGRIVGMTDGVDAIKQHVWKVLGTERYRHFIYSGDFGHEIRLGLDAGLIRAELRRWITEALIADERIVAVSDFALDIEGDSAQVSFTVESIFGSFRMERTVGTHG